MIKSGKNGSNIKIEKYESNIRVTNREYGTGSYDEDEKEYQSEEVIRINHSGLGVVAFYGNNIDKYIHPLILYTNSSHAYGNQTEPWIQSD
ncbi:hypothetical protein K502DRAFT_368768 [Neoconidiobolus thromboides FSU 785]|nr:hypothetical protein K502DRAFT_368768 [Neoconidiobolus thromboides FSU 785]